MKLALFAIGLLLGASCAFAVQNLGIVHLIHHDALGRTQVVQATLNNLSFDGSGVPTLTVEYSSDSLWCSGFGP